uniref:Lymphocyte antigen 86-like n=1 Tax=Sinocyclocheilus grahami TaxID=75366 RepID=A0A672QV71_SINGR
MKTRLCDNMLLVLILIMVQMNRVHSQDPQWPVHTVCDSERITVTYRSCEIITVESSFKSKIDLALKADFDLKLRAINQDGFLIACVNATLSFHGLLKEDDIRFVMPGADPCWSLREYINLVLWIAGSAFTVDEAGHGIITVW